MHVHAAGTCTLQGDLLSLRIYFLALSQGLSLDRLVYIRLYAQNTVLINNFVICGTEASVGRAGP